MNAFLQQLVQAFQHQAIDELAFRGYLSPRTLEELSRERQRPQPDLATVTTTPAAAHPFARRAPALKVCCA